MGITDFFSKQVGGMVSDFRKNANEQEKKYERWGITQDVTKTLVSRIEALQKLELEMFNDAYDIEDKVSIMVMTIEIAGKPWGRRDPEWMIRYMAWTKLQRFWVYYKQGRNPHFMRKVRIERKLKVALPDGTEKSLPVFMSVSPSTALAMKESLPEEEFKILGMGQDGTEQYFSDFSKAPELSFADKQKEFNVKNFGEGYMVIGGRQLMAWAWPDIDVSAKEVTVFHVTPQAGVLPQGKEALPVGIAPEFNLKPSDKVQQ